MNQNFLHRCNHCCTKYNCTYNRCAYDRCAKYSCTYNCCAKYSCTYNCCAKYSCTYDRCAKYSCTYNRCAKSSSTYNRCTCSHSSTYNRCTDHSSTYNRCTDHSSTYNRCCCTYNRLHTANQHLQPLAPTNSLQHTTAAPTTAAPTTAAPTTAAPTTAAPTTVDVGACTMDVTVTAATDLYWTSPGFPSNYPDDITCTLTVTIPADLPMGLVTVTPMAGSAIYTTPGCSSDKMTYTSSMGATAISCGSNLDEVSEGAVFDGPKTFTLTFTSSSSDGGKTSSGFRYHIRGFDLMGK
nr:keratin-associated protein 4-3-like [Penaeus vannamei]